MKVCLLADAANVHTRKWVDALTKHNIIVSVITLRAWNYDNCEVYQLTSKTYSNRKNDVEYNKMKVALEVIPQVRKLVKQIKPDILHAHYSSSFGLFGALTFSKPLVVSVWGSDVSAYPVNSVIKTFLTKFVFSRATAICATSHFLRDVTAKYTNKEIVITPFGVDTDLFTPDLTNKNSDVFHVTMIKALEKRYGVGVLLEAMGQFNEKHKDWKLTIAGEGHDKEYFFQEAENLSISEKVNFVGIISQHEVAELLKSSDVHVVPSIVEESFGVSAVEGSSCSVPVIASNIGGIPEVIENNKTGLLIESNNSNELSKALLKLRNNRDLRTHLGSEGRKLILERYKWEANVKIMIKLYRGLI